MFDNLGKSIDELGTGLLGALNTVQNYFGKELSGPVSVKTNILQLVGNTPLIQLHTIGSHIPNVNFFLKAEFLNPTGSVKDRTALAMILDAEKRGLLQRGTTIIEIGAGTSAIGFAWIARIKRYRIICMVHNETPESRIHKLRLYGAEVISYDKTKNNVYEVIQEKCKDCGEIWIADDKKSMANPNIHYRTTGPEIWRDLGKKVDVVVSGGGSGGTITGIGRYLKSQKGNIKVVLSVQEGSLYLNESGDGLTTKNLPKLPETFDSHLVDHVFSIKKDEATLYQSELYQKEGIFCGFAVGLILAGAIKFAEKFYLDRENPAIYRDQLTLSALPVNIVVIAPDRE